MHAEKPIETRRAEPADGMGIGAVHGRSWQAAYRGIVPDDHLDAIDLAERGALWTEILRGEHPVEGVADPTNDVALVDGKIVGFSVIGAFRDEPDNARAGELWAMYADPDYWGTGIGRALMHLTLAGLAHVDRMYLWVFADNPRARRFYERSGWTDDGIVKQFEIGGVTIDETRYSRQP